MEKRLVKSVQGVQGTSKRKEFVLVELKLNEN